jgi:heat shock protein HslJ
MKNNLLVIFAILILLSSCKDNPTQTKVLLNLDTLTGTAWKWDKFFNEKGQMINVIDSTTAPFVIFFESDTTARGLAGCNDFGMNFRRSGDSIYFSPGFTTDVWCTFTDLYESSLFDICQIFSANENELILKTENPSSPLMFFSRNVSKPTFHYNEVHEIDMNKDSAIDFKFIYSDELNNDTIIGHNLYIMALNDNMSTYWWGCVKENEIIDSKIHFYSGQQEISGCAKYYFGWYDYWYPPFDKEYLPVKLKLNDGYHYGWICFSVSRSNGNLVFHDFAYNKTPEMMIIAGKK